MKRSRFTEERIIAILREQEAGVAATDPCRKHGVSSPTLHKWKAMFGGLELSEAPWARRTARLDALAHHRALALGGRPAAGFAGGSVSPTCTGG